MAAQLLLEQRRGLKLRGVLEHANLPGELREEEGLLDAEVTGPDHHQLLGLAVERAVAARAEMDTRAAQLLLPGDTQRLVDRSGGDQHRSGGELLTVVGDRHQVVAGPAQPGHAHAPQDPQAVAVGLRDEAPLDLDTGGALGKSRAAHQAGGHRGLAPGGHPVDDEAVHPFPDGVERGAEARRARPDDDQVEEPAG